MDNTLQTKSYENVTQPSHPTLGFASFIVVLFFFLIWVADRCGLWVPELLESAHLLGWFLLGTGVSISSILKEKHQGKLIFFPIVALVLSLFLLLVQFATLY